jgi:opacity protein-like surface antigen
VFYHAHVKTRTCALLLAIAAAAGLPARAQVTPWYVGIAVGESRTGRELVANRESTITNALSISTDFDARDVAFKATVGYRFFPWLAVEVDYTDLGKHSLSSDMVGGDPPAAAGLFLERRVRGFGADAVLFAPVAAQWKVYGRVGAFRARLEARQALGGNIVFTNGDPTERERSTTQSETVLRWGAGTQFELSDCSGLRLEWQRQEDIGKAFRIGGSGTTGEAPTDAVLVGFYYRF